MSDALGAGPSAPAAADFRIVQRTITKPAQEPDIRSLYLGGPNALGAPSSTPEKAAGSLLPEAESVVAGSSAPTCDFAVDADGRVRVPAGDALTFGTYFNAFPASYWRRWTDLESVTLVVRARGRGNIVVRRSTARGTAARVEARPVAGDGVETFEFELSLAPFIDGGWYWFDLEASGEDLVLEEAHWGVWTTRSVPGTVTIGITTHNRPDFCVRQLVDLSQDETVLAVVDEVVVVDQGTQKIRDDRAYPAVAAALGEKLRVIEQPNLGGSGGFSRAMSEALEKGTSTHVLLLDDDVVCELESVLRVVALADLAQQTMLVGGQMLSLTDRAALHEFGETVEPRRWFFGSAPLTRQGHNFSRKALHDTPWLHRRVDVDYNAWWMCLIPLEVVRKVGLSFPMFIKWDDAEYGVRAAAHGYPTVTLPGAAVWHMPWTEKDDVTGWQAYFHARNRLLSALLHSPHERGGKLLGKLGENHLKRLSSMQYGTGALMLQAFEDVLEGPERLHRDMAHRLGEMREVLARYDEGRSSRNVEDYPPPQGGKAVPSPTTTRGMAALALRGLARQVLPVPERARTVPDAVVPAVDNRWFRVSHYDSAVVSSADGTSASWLRRDRDEALRQVRTSATLLARLRREWPDLAQQYRAAAAEMASPEVWKQTFGGRSEA